MLPAIRFRRYRVFLVLAAIITILLVRFSHTRNGDLHAQIEGLDFSSPPKNDGPGGSAPPEVTRPEASGEESKEAKDRPSPPVKIEGDKPSPAIPSPPTAVQSVPDVVLPDRKIASPAEVPLGNELSEDGIHAVGPPGRQEFPTFTAVPTTIHWEKQVEHFPVPTESIIGLPTGLPATIPKIQHAFNDETPDAKINRETRQLRVREEFSKAWSGYKEHAWLHDELAPVSGKLRDPFCGWAATLVDSLDALYIMGLHEDFEEAVRAVNEIDFTTSPRADIPVFETTIRYLGGLLSAYDVSGGKYRSLLSKAEELAEILMGAFDTPNRMPVLFYRWKPTFASQPHRASQRSNLAELGSLSMEFTRLAQLTKNPRYYDAVARVTNALEEFQDRTKLRGVFPENVDASGCNRTVPLSKHEPVSNQGSAKSPGEAAEQPEGYQPSMPKTVAEPRPIKKGGKNENAPSLELQILPGEPSKAKILGWGDNEKPKNSKRDSMKSEAAVITLEKNSKEPEGGETSNTALPTDPKTGLPLDLSGAKSRIGQSLGDWDCTPQGLESSKPSGSDRFSMGGGQDSTYEYFPKQYLLLGGREDKYRQMYLKTIEAVRKWMLYRPMIPGNHDILLSGKVTTAGNPEVDLEFSAEVEHLTCFIGGMVGMGAKIFDIKSDLELAKKLTDGCVWAYGSMPSGIMAESAIVLPCENAESCAWNETAYFEYLDPKADERDQMVEEYLANKAALEAEREAKKAATAKAEVETTNVETTANQSPAGSDPQDKKVSSNSHISKSTSNDAPRQLSNTTVASLRKRQSSPKNDLPQPVTHNFKNDLTKEAQNPKKGPGESKVSDDTEVVAEHYEGKFQSTEAELRSMEVGRQTEVPPPTAQSKPVEDLPDPARPLSHKEFVAARIEQGGLLPGYVNIRSKKYILRPEAIESVWYMYRITGDPSWQDKGWKMFEAILNATSAKYGHSAIYDVTQTESLQSDEMESFWLAETLKYFYLLFSTPDTISLDEWVLNTEAHPFKRDW